MPPIREGSPPLRRPRPKPKRKPAYRLPSGGPRGDAPQSRGMDRAAAHKRKPTYKRALRKTRQEQPKTQAFSRPLSDPMAERQREQRRKTRKAANRLPALRLPHIPDLRDNQGRRIITPAAKARLERAVRREAKRAGGLRKLYESAPVADRRKLLLFRDLQSATAERATVGRPSLARQLRPGPAPTKVGVGPATVNLTSLTNKLIGQTSFKYGANSPEQRFVVNALRDVRDLGAAPFVAGYEGGAAAWEAAHGDTSRAVRLGEGLVEGLKESVPGQLAQGDVEGALQAFREHPVFGVLDVAGAASIAGRSAGAVARGLGSQASKGGLRGGLARAGSTVRPPIAMVDDAGAAKAGRGLVERTYSKDLSRKAAQVAADARREPLRDADGNVVTVSQRGREVPVLRAGTGERGRHARRQADFLSARTNAVERLVRDQAASEMKVRGVRGKRAQDLVSMVVEGTVTSAKHFEADLKAHAARLREVLEDHERLVAAGRKDESPFRHSGELRAAKSRLRMVEEALSSPRVLKNKAKIVAAGEAVGRKLNEVEAEALRLGLLTGSRAARSKRVPAALEHMGARFFTPEELRGLEGVDADALRHGEIRHNDGSRLSNAEVDELLKSRGRDPETVAYLPHRLDVRGRRAFHTQFRPGSRGTMEKGETRTGSAYRKGVTESSARLIQEQGVRQATQIAKAHALDKMAGEHGLRRPDGKYWTAQEALEVAQRLLEDTGERFVPMRAFAAKLDSETQRIIREDLQGPGGMESLGERMLNDRKVYAADEPGKARARNVVLVPGEMVDQLQRHMRPAGSLAKFMQMLNRPFRFAVLAQPRWLVGNFVEPFFVRLPTVGSGAINVFGLGNDVRIANRAIRQMERSPEPGVRQAARELRAHQEGGLFIGGRGATIRRSADELPVFNSAYGQVVSKLPVVAQGIELVRSIGHLLMAPGNVYFRLNRGIERFAQDAAIGKKLRQDMQEFSGSWMKAITAHGEALSEAQRGLVNTPTQRRFMEMQHELLGQYEGFPPWLREATQSWTPFLPWVLNAGRFVLWTMPAHHTALTAVLQKINDVVAKDWEETHKGTPPGGLRLAIPTKKGGWIDLIRYTPYGLTGPIGQGDLEALDQATPIFQGPSAALFGGLDPFGRKLQMSDGDEANIGDRILAALNQTGESLVPYVAQARRLREGGGTAFGDSTLLSPKTKPGTDHMSGFRRTFDPFRPTYLRPPGGERVVERPRPSSTAPGADLDSQISRALEQVDAAAGAGADPLDAEIQRALEQLP